MLLSHGIGRPCMRPGDFPSGDYAMYDDILCMEERNRRGLRGCWAATRRESCGCCWTTPMTPMI